MKCQKHLFQMEEDNIYLNGAYMSPLLRTAETAGYEGIMRKRSPYKLKEQDFFEPVDRIRVLFNQLIRAEETNRVVVIPSASYGLASIANNIKLKPEQKIIVTGEQFPSNYYCWKNLTNKSNAQLEIIGPPPATTPNRSKSWNESILNAIDEHTALVAMPHVHWTDGTKFDLIAIRQKLDQFNGLLVIDATQSLGALSFNQSLIKADALIVSGYKWMLGPYGIGLAYIGARFDHGEPIENSWLNRPDSDDFANLIQYKNDYREGARRYEVGEAANFILIPMLEAAIKTLLELNPDSIQAYCKSITEKSMARMREYGYIIPEEGVASHLFGVRTNDENLMFSIKKILVDNKITVSYRGSSMRISPNIYNTEEELMILAGLLQKVLS